MCKIHIFAYAYKDGTIAYSINRMQGYEHTFSLLLINCVLTFVAFDETNSPPTFLMIITLSLLQESAMPFILTRPSAFLSADICVIDLRLSCLVSKYHCYVVLGRASSIARILLN